MKRLAIPAIILAAVVVIWIIQSGHEERQTSGRTVENFLGLDAHQIDRIEIYSPADTFHFYVDDGVWYLDDSIPRRTDTLVIANILTTAATITVGDVISENPDRQAEFNVDNLTGTLVNFYGDGELLNSIIIGKPTPDFGHTYIRRRDENGVHAAAGMLTYTFTRSRGQWLDKMIFPFDSSRVAQIDFVYPDKAIRLERQDSIWMASQKPFTDKAPTDTAKTRVMLDLVDGLRANDFVNAADSGKVDFSDVDFTMNVTLRDGTTHSLVFSKVAEDNHRHYCRLDQGADTYVIYSSVYGILRADFASFMP
ncbi:MAG: DUF4340 domain-containing protein [candidate division Zixibacteria bacterium]|nr:DUF4340 domain-containing protein [candidate division Zixibacteria bacterium]